MRADVVAVSVFPTSPSVNQAATVTVTATDPCGAVHIDFGDGMAQTYPITVLPFNTQHTWTTSGAKTITATGQGNCTGQATLTVQVSSTILQLCAKLACGERPKMFFLKPEITALFGFSTPGGFLAIAGKGFGTNLGSVVASLKTWSGGSIERRLEAIEWTNTMVGVQWPTDFSGVRHQSATLVLTTAGGGKSVPQPITFSPELDLKTLPQADVQVVKCSTSGNAGLCNNVVGNIGPPHWYFSTPKELIADAAIVGAHYNRWGVIGNDEGTDTYRIVLKRDWVMDSFEWRVSVDPGEGFVRKPAGFTKGASWSPSVDWEVTPNDHVAYAAVVTIIGPRGVPHK